MKLNLAKGNIYNFDVETRRTLHERVENKIYILNSYHVHHRRIVRVEEKKGKNKKTMIIIKTKIKKPYRYGFYKKKRRV